MKSTIDWLDSAWLTFLSTPLPWPATVGPKALWPWRFKRSMTLFHADPSCQDPWIRTNV
jgi:hypothetical protein